MPRKVTFRLEGAAELRRTLRRAGDDLHDLREAHAEAAEIVVPRGKARAPVGPTGRLSASIRGSGTKQGASIRAGGSGIPYAGVQEFGWARRHIPAQPYLVPAVEETQPTWMERYRAAVERILDRVKGADPI